MISSGMVVPVGNRLRPVSPRQEEPSLHWATIAGQKSLDARRSPRNHNGTTTFAKLPDHFFEAVAGPTLRGHLSPRPGSAVLRSLSGPQATSYLNVRFVSKPTVLESFSINY